MGKIETTILQHSQRGMDLLQPHLSEQFCTDAANAILNWTRGTVLVVTGFYVAGHMETDGPPGVVFLCRALQHFGFSPVILVEELCRGYFEQFQIPVRYVGEAVSDGELREILEGYDPVGMISVERCGENIQGDYANLRGVSIAAHTAPLDHLFEMVSCSTIGIGDGGNEIGMGNLAAVIEEQLTLVPCRVCTDHLILATVSNWGALGLSAAMGWLPEEWEYLRAYETAAQLSFIDGITKRFEASEDGFSLEVGKQVLEELRTAMYARSAT